MPATNLIAPTKQEYAISRKTLLIESSWEVCNQVGGIYTVIRSKVPVARKIWGDDYCLIGPAVHPDRHAELDPLPVDEKGDVMGQVVEKLRKEGFDVFYGVWLVTGRPKVILLNPENAKGRQRSNINALEKYYDIPAQESDELLQDVIAFSYISCRLFTHLNEIVFEQYEHVIAHFHEWMASLPVLTSKRLNWPIKTIFTTHATLLGRYIAMNDIDFYDKLDSYDWKSNAEKYGIQARVMIERQSAQMADCFTTVSEITGKECRVLLGKGPDKVLPNGLNIKRFVADHEVQVLHAENKDKIHQFVLGHFFHSYSFDLDNTLYFFTSGRYEYHNKGYDLTLKALQKLNKMMKREKLDTTVVMFIITRRPVWSINPEVMQSRGVMQEIQQNIRSIQHQLGKRLFMEAVKAEGDYRLPNLNSLIDDYWKLRYRRTIQAWKSNRWPIIVTHNLHNPDSDDVLQYLNELKLINSPKDKVKIVYHPDFISSTNPLFGIDYSDFVRGCHLGIFPSYYEPWGYTPLECIARGVPTITSDLSGIGDYIKSNVTGGFDDGVEVLNRDGVSFEKAAQNLARQMFNFVKKSRRYRIAQRGRAEDLSESFDWHYMIRAYMRAYKFALEND
jgi:glycogen(starch) synthase